MTNQNPNDNNLVVSYLTMRKAVGWLGISLPFFLLFGNIILNNSDVFNNKWFFKFKPDYHYKFAGSFKDTVSDFYYTTVGEIFTGVLCAVALFLFCYKGHPMRKGDKGLSDNMMANLAAVFALGVALFPTSSKDFISDNLRNFLSSNYIGYLHYFFAASFFIALAFMSIINFRRAQKQELFGTGPDDPLYLWCGIIMLACIILVPVFSGLLEPRNKILQNVHSTFILETIALISFGVSWLRKGRADLMLKKLVERFKKQEHSVGEQTANK